MPTALVLPGQGSQRPGTGAPWRDTPGWAFVEPAGDVLGHDVARLLLDAGADELRATRQAAGHTPLMEPARAPFEAALYEARFGPAAVPVVSGVTAAPYDEDVAGTLSRQLTSPARWREVLLALPGLVVDRVVELGPGGVLTGLVKRTLPGVQAVSVETPTDLALLD